LFHPMRNPPVGRFGGRGQDPILVVKNHWMWLLLQIFGPSATQLQETRNYVGDVLLLEEDHVPSPDIFLSLNFLLNMKNLSPLGECAGCWAVAMGGSSPCRPSSSAQEAWTLTCRHTQFVNTGLVFNLSIFHSVVASDFLAFRDGWDWSLYHVVQTQQMLRCQPKCSPRVLSPYVSRINNIGTSGVTMRDDDPHLQQQLNFPHIPDDIWERGFNPANLRLDIDSLQSSTHGLSFKPLSDALYFGYEVGFLDQVDWS